MASSNLRLSSGMAGTSNFRYQNHVHLCTSLIICPEAVYASCDKPLIISYEAIDKVPRPSAMHQRTQSPHGPVRNALSVPPSGIDPRIHCDVSTPFREHQIPQNLTRRMIPSFLLEMAWTLDLTVSSPMTNSQRPTINPDVRVDDRNLAVTDGAQSPPILFSRPPRTM